MKFLSDWSKEISSWQSKAFEEPLKWMSGHSGFNFKIFQWHEFFKCHLSINSFLLPCSNASWVCLVSRCKTSSTDYTVHTSWRFRLCTSGTNTSLYIFVQSCIVNVSNYSMYLSKLPISNFQLPSFNISLS